jgi:steroid delta-isomerase-like uncharacterized protein
VIEMTTAQETTNKATFGRFLEASNSGDLELMSKTINEVFDPDVVISTPLPVRSTGAKAIAEVFSILHRAFPDLHIDAEDMIAEEDKVVGRNVVTGTHRGDYMGLPPTGKPVTYNEIFILRFIKGRIAEIWGVVDVLSQLKQLGVLQA